MAYCRITGSFLRVSTFVLTILLSVACNVTLEIYSISYRNANISLTIFFYSTILLFL